MPLWSCPVSHFKLTSVQTPSLGNSTVWLYFLNYHHSLYCKSTQLYIFQFYLFLNTGKNISTQWPGSATIKKDGSSLSISPVTAANEGEYMCLVKENDVELIRAYNITVDGEKRRYTLLFYHTYKHFIFCLYTNTVEHFEFG